SQDQPPKDPNADPFGFGDWYINADRTLWVGLLEEQMWRAGGEKVIWIRPAGSQLVITGHRLDAVAPPVHADIPCCYPTGFQVTGLTFPTEGCWEVTARTEEYELRFVTEVAPVAPRTMWSECTSLADAVHHSAAIVVGWVTTTESEGRYAWHDVTVLETWKVPRGRSGIGDRFSLLQDLHAEPRLAKNGRYVLFLQRQPWQLVCGQRSVVEQQGEQATAREPNALWPGGTLADLKAEVKKLVATP
ncbi:MAG TPA: hypothetical protein VER55_08005, partial [Ardenticatenaceae bacterium]|nr:hypothetical protein [Ardenticatenaceae bacterium]